MQSTSRVSKVVQKSNYPPVKRMIKSGHEAVTLDASYKWCNNEHSTLYCKDMQGATSFILETNVCLTAVGLCSDQVTLHSAD